MDSRFLGFLAIAFIMVLMYQEWVNDYGPTPSLLPTTSEHNETTINAQTATDLPPADLPELTQADVPTSFHVDAPTANPSSSVTQTISVNTDVLSLEIDLQGGNLVMADLLRFPEALKAPEKKVRLYNQSPTRFFAAQSGLQSAQHAAPNHYASYHAEQASYELDDSVLVVPLYWQENGIKVTKTYTFRPGKYLIDVSHKVENLSEQPWSGRQYRQFQRASVDDGNNGLIRTYTGGVIYSREERYEKILYDDIADAQLKRKFSNGWAAMIQHYFLSAWIPHAEEENQYYTATNNIAGRTRYILGLNSPMQQVLPNESIEFTSQLYVGPKTHQRLEEITEGLELTVDFGWLTPVSEPLFWALTYIHDYVGNWGWAIILLTLGIKLLFYKLSEASYKSMAKMRKVTPKLQSIRERYADDRQRQSQAMMELYKKEKINPMGGCFPILIQIPVFIALYWVLLESVELRQAPFILWLNDLSTKDPFFVLPVIMGVTMYIQQKLNPAPVDPIQAKVFMFLPFIFTVFFMFFPSGLVLYWVVNNTLTILQQWYITNKVMAK